ncbi:MAG: hypothetical protein QOG85_1239 [Gaiellaceae bacterium]|jgi:hypothetical protein|nr:hypothetical protein [Gaiellaceae bacterium]
MTVEPPPLRDLPSGHLEVRRRHLAREIRRLPARRGWTRPALAFGAAAVAAAAFAYVFVPSAGRKPPPQVEAPTGLAYVFHARFPLTSDSARYYLPSLADESLFLPVPAIQLARLQAVPTIVYAYARREAAWNGDRSPTRVEWVRTARQRAVSSQSGDRVDTPRRPVWFVVLDGHFVAHNAHFIGRRAPRGTVLSFTIDVRRRIILDLALGSTRPDYSGIGKRHSFRLGRSSR